MTTYFYNRIDAGQQLAKALLKYKNIKHAIVLALPRGGVPVAHEVSLALHLPLDLMLVRKLGMPEQEELTMGAIAHGGMHVFNENIINRYGIPHQIVHKVVDKERKELARRNALYRDNRPMPDLKHCIVILVDDGMATGANMQVAIEMARKQHARHIVAAVPVSSGEAYDLVDRVADEVVSLHVPEPFPSVGSFYEDFSQLSDEEVISHLNEAMPEDTRPKMAGHLACETI